jgi:hypothetical protein
MNIDNKCKCGLNKFINRNFCCVNCEINNTHNYLCTKYISHIKNKKIFYKQDMKNKNPYNEENKIKTLFGKDDYLFLINDTSRSLENHCKKFIQYNPFNIDKYLSFINNNKIFFFVFPDKEIICKNFLPNEYKIRNRNKLYYYKAIFKKLIYDSTELFDISDYSKTDTHINLKGLYKFYMKACSIISQKFNLNIVTKKIIIKQKEVIGNGDLIQGLNIGTNVAKKIKEIIYYTDIPYSIINNKYNTDSNIKILEYDFTDISNKYNNKIINWRDIHDKIIHYTNVNALNKKKIVIFHDSFLLPIIFLFTELFYEVYTIKKFFNTNIIHYINPDYVLEFRVERFLYL